MANSISYNNVNVTITPSDSTSLPSQPSLAGSPSIPNQFTHPSHQKYLATLQANGIDTSSYFSILAPTGTPVLMRFSPDGVPTTVDTTAPFDAVEKRIFSNGYLKNNAMRRFLPADFWHLMQSPNFAKAIRNRGYEYSIKTVGNELHAQAKIAASDIKAYETRSLSYNLEQVIHIMKDDLYNLRDHISSLKERHCKGVPYVRFHSKNIFISDLGKKIYSPIKDIIRKMEGLSKKPDSSVRAYEVDKCFAKFQAIRHHLPYDTDMSQSFIQAFKGAGAYYFLQNLIMYHGVNIKLNDKFLDRYESLSYLDELAKSYKNNDQWHLVGFAKQVIKDNNFDLKARLKALGVRGY